MADRKPKQDGGAPAGAGDVARILAELRDTLLTELDGRLQSMIQAADSTLFELARSSPPKQLPGFLNARHLLRADAARSALVEQFRTAVGRRLQAAETPESIAAAQLALRGNEEVEENIQLADMAVRAGGDCDDLLQDLAGRFETLRQQQQDFPGISSISPLGLCEAFVSAVTALPEGTAARGALNRLFEHSVLPRLRPLYAGIVAVCERHGIRASPTRAADRRAARTQTAGLDSATAEMLRRVHEGHAPRVENNAESPSGFLPDFKPAFSDADLALLLLDAAQGKRVAGLDQAQLRMLSHRANLAARMINDILDDPQIPPQLHALVEAFRFPAIKAALADTAFFTDPQHPVRGLINDMASMAGDSRIGGHDASLRFDGWARRVLRQAQLGAADVRDRMVAGRPLQASDIEAFLIEQAKQHQQRRTDLLRRVREVVDQELELCTATCSLPDPVWPLLRNGWGPMMASHLLRNGPESQLYRSGMDLLHRVLYALNPESPNARTPAERAALRVELFRALTGVGMPKERAKELLQGLDQALDSLGRSDVPGTGAAQPRPSAAPASVDEAPEWEPLSATMEITLTGSSRRRRDESAEAPPAPAAKPVAAAAAVTDAASAALATEAELEMLSATTEIPLTMAATGPAPVETLPQEEVPAKEAAEEAAPVATAAQAEPTEAAAHATDFDATLPVSAFLADSEIAELAREMDATPAPATIACLPLDLPTPQQLLDQLLRVGAWFRVYDKRSQGTRWLKLTSWFPQVRRASFSEFDGHNPLTVTAADLLEDLLEGRSEPIDIPPQTVLILQALRQQHADGRQQADGEAGSASMVA